MMLTSRELTKAGDTIEVKIKVVINKSRYDADDYLAVKSFFGKMVDMLSEPIVLKAK